MTDITATFEATSARIRLTVAPAQTTFILDAPADHFRFSPLIVPLAAEQFLDIAFTPIQLNHAPGMRFAQAISFWLSSTTAAPETSADAVSFDFGWSSGLEWTFGYRTAPGSFRWTDAQGAFVMGAERRVRVLRRADGAAEFWLEGEKLATLDVSGDVRGLYAQVVGATASFSYGPGAVTTPSSLSAVDTGLRLDRPAHTCEPLGASCVPRR